MKKSFHIEKKRIERFRFDPVRKMKGDLRRKPELRKQISKDFQGALESEGIMLDDKFYRDIHRRWRAQIGLDIREHVRSHPGSKSRYLSRAIEGKPLKLKVKIEKKTGKHKKTLMEGRI